MPDALYFKKDLISSEITLLNISKTIGRYNLYRQAELALKIKILKRIQEVKEDIEAIKENFPKPKIEKKNEEKINPFLLIEDIKKDTKEDATLGLERQLEEIQARLREFN